jgi:hypothetical protein
MNDVVKFDANGRATFTLFLNQLSRAIRKELLKFFLGGNFQQLTAKVHVRQQSGKGPTCL